MLKAPPCLPEGEECAAGVFNQWRCSIATRKKGTIEKLIVFRSSARMTNGG
jgi:hypothetical protein